MIWWVVFVLELVGNKRLKILSAESDTDLDLYEVSLKTIREFGLTAPEIRIRKSSPGIEPSTTIDIGIFRFD